MYLQRTRPIRRYTWVEHQRANWITEQLSGALTVACWPAAQLKKRRGVSAGRTSACSPVLPLPMATLMTPGHWENLISWSAGRTPDRLD